MSQTQPGQVPPFPGAQPPPAAKPPRNTLGLAALVVAVLGFIFAVMEGAYIVGWILLPIAFVLSLVALVQRDRPKKMAVAALTISIVGTIAGGIAFMGSLGRAFEDAAGGPVTAAPAPVQTGTQTEDAPAPAAPQSETQGTRSNPYPLGSVIANKEWSVTVNSFSPDATAAVLAENQFNDEPDAGHRYALANVTVTRLGQEAASPIFDVSVDYVTSQGNVIHSSDKMAVAPDGLSNNELYTDASSTGNVVLHVPEGDEGLLRLKLGIFSGDDIFVAIK